MKSVDEGAPGQSDPRASSRDLFERDALPLSEKLLRRAVGMTRNHVDAEDLLQDTMINAYKSFHTFEQGSNLSAWLNRIMTNAYINGYRKTMRAPPPVSIDQISAELLAAQSRYVGAGASAEDQALGTTLDVALATAVRSLPEAFRAAVYYADVEGLSYNEIAEITGAKCGTVMSRLHRGRRRLRPCSRHRPSGDSPSESLMSGITGCVHRLGIRATSLR